jgi:hypothetical protein
MEGQASRDFRAEGRLGSALPHPAGGRPGVPPGVNYERDNPQSDNMNIISDQPVADYEQHPRPGLSCQLTLGS